MLQHPIEAISYELIALNYLAEGGPGSPFTQWCLQGVWLWWPRLLLVLPWGSRRPWPHPPGKCRSFRRRGSVSGYSRLNGFEKSNMAMKMAEKMVIVMRTTFLDLAMLSNNRVSFSLKFCGSTSKQTTKQTRQRRRKQLNDQTRIFYCVLLRHRT